MICRLEPVGQNETLLGATNRARDAKSKFPHAAYWVGIENGMWFGGANACSTNESAAAAATQTALQTVAKFNAAASTAATATAAAGAVSKAATGSDGKKSAPSADPNAYRHWVDAAAFCLINHKNAVLSGWSDVLPLPDHWTRGALSASPPEMYSHHEIEWTADSG